MSVSINMKRSIFTESQQKFILENYPRFGAKHCAASLNIAESFSRNINRFCNKRGIYLTSERKKQHLEELIKKANATRMNKPEEDFAVNSEYFKSVVSPSHAYVLGILWADGYIVKDAIRLETIKIDGIKFYKIFMNTGDWKFSERCRIGKKPQSTINTNNKHFAQYLRDNDYLPNCEKSADKILKTIPENLLKFWFRGLIDGDGCFYVNKKNKSTQFSLAGSYNQDWSFFVNELEKHNIPVSIKKRKQFQNGNLNKSSIVRITKRKSIIELGKWLYDGYPEDGIGLSRKHLKWKEMEEIHNHFSDCP